MEFRKIKFNGAKTELTWTTQPAGEDVITHSLSSFDLPEPEFRTALDDFKGYVLRLLELPTDYADGLAVTGVTIRRSDAMGYGIVVTAKKKVAGAPSPVVLNTPFLPEISEDGPSLSTADVEAIEELELRAARYVEGCRAQADLFEEAA